MAQKISPESAEAIWRSVAQGDSADVDALHAAIETLAGGEDTHHLRAALQRINAGTGVGYGAFLSVVTSLHGSWPERLERAFDLWDADNDGAVSAEDLHTVLSAFGYSREETDRIFADIDGDGDNRATQADFLAYLPEPAASHDAYRDYAPDLSGVVQSYRQVPPPLGGNDAEETSFDERGTSVLQMQIGLFRLLQGAAYRTFRENYAVNCFTHLQARKLPYTVPHFVGFVDASVALYKAMGVCPAECAPALDALVASVGDEYLRLKERIIRWDECEKTPAMAAAMGTMRSEHAHVAGRREALAAAVELALTMQQHEVGAAEIASSARRCSGTYRSGRQVRKRRVTIVTSGIRS
ncbi:MAG: EF-hand domain-containing protein [Pseudomonadota bacterium]